MKKFVKISISLFVLLLLLSSSFIPFSTTASGESKGGWKVEKFEKVSGASSERIEVDNKGYPHLLYTEFHSNPKNQTNPRMELKYAYWTGTSWKKTTIDIIGIYYAPDRFSFKLDKDGNPHVAYGNLSISEKPINRTSSFYNYSYEVKYATYINGEWRIETIEKGRKTGYNGGPPLSFPPYPHLSLDSQGVPHIIYASLASQKEENYTDWNLVLKYAKKTSNGWEIENVTENIGKYWPYVGESGDDGSEAYGGKFWLYMDESGNPYIIQNIYIYKYSTTVAYEKTIYTKEDGIWTSTQLCRWNKTDVYFYPVEKSFESHLPKYLLLKEPFLRCLRWNGEKYEVYVIDKKVYSPWEASLSIDREGIPYVAYAGKDGLRYAVFDGDKWLVSTVVLTPNNVLNPRIAAYNSDVIFMSYQYGYFFLIGPNPPSELNLTTTLSDSKIKLTWEPPLNDGNATITAYKIYRGSSENSLELMASVNGSVTEYLDTNVTNGEKYYYAVSAVNPVGESNLSEIVSIEIPKEKEQTPSIGFAGMIGVVAIAMYIKYRRKKEKKK